MLVAEIKLPDAGLTATMRLSRNTDPKLPASHTIALRFAPAANSQVSNIKTIDMPQMRVEDDPTGAPLAGAPVPIMPNYFLIGLSNNDKMSARNMELLRDRSWVDIPMALSSGRIAKLTFEKGPSGNQALIQTMQNWQQTAPQDQPQQAAIAPQQPALATAAQGRRVALVIGNTKYEAQSPLVNPANDANLIASSLRSAGFQQVIVKNDLKQNQLLRAIRDFAEVADKADWSVVYYAGHGMGYNGANYMIPVDARLKADRDIDIEAVDVGKIYNAISGSRSLRLVILDMCRTNPFAKTMTRTVASRSIGRGLVAPSESEAGEFTVFAAKDGQESLDGEGKNSPFAEAFAKRLLLPNTDITRIFAYVRDDVMRVTNKQQQPFTYGSLPPADFFFVQK